MRIARHLCFPLLGSLLLLFGMADAAFGTTRYIAQTAGTVTCNGGSVTAITPATWNATAEAPGDTSYISGTLTGSSTTLLTFPTAGTSGNVITLTTCAEGGSITYPAIPTTGAIVDNQNFTTITGVTLTSTTNGDCVGCTTTTVSVGILLNCSNCKVESSTIGPIFQRGVNDVSINGYQTMAIQFTGGDNIHIDQNNVSNAYILIAMTSGANVTNLEIDHNTLDYSSHMIFVGPSFNGANFSGVLIHDNQLGPHFNIWQDTDTSCGGTPCMHADGIFVLDGVSSSTLTAQIYNNLITGDMCTTANTNCSGYIYLDANTNTYVFNNIIQHLSNTGTGPEGGILIRGTANNFSGVHVLNNTYLGGPNATQMKNGGGNAGTGLVLENNIWSTGQSFYIFGPTNFLSLSLSDYNTFYLPRSYVAAKGGDSSPTFYNTLANWQAADSQDSHSLNSNPNLSASYVPNSGSPVIGTGTNLTSMGIAALDIGAPQAFGVGGSCGTGCKARSSTLAWDMGAYPFSTPMAPAFSGVSIAQAPLASGGSTGTLYTDIVNNVFNNATANSLAFAATAVTPIVCWNVVDTGATAMTLDWTTLDADLNAWITAGAPYVNVIMAPTVEGGNNGSPGGCTPPYVFTTTYQSAIGAAQPQDIVVTSSYKGGSGSPYANANGATGCTTGCAYNINSCVTGGCMWTNSSHDTSGLPVTLPGEPIATAWPAFITQYFIHFSTFCSLGVGVTDCANAATVTSHLKYTKFGPTQGGEASVLGLNFWPVPAAFSTFSAAYVGSNSVAPTTPVCHLTGTGGVLSYIESLYQLLGTNIVTYDPQQWAVVESMHANGNPPNNSYADCEAIYADANGLGIGTNGLQLADAANYAAGSPLIPGNTNCTSDWCYNFNDFILNGHGKYLQTLTISDPTNGLSQPAAAAANSNGLTGSLVNLVTFAGQRGARLIEIYPCDALFAFTTTWSGLPSSGNPASLTNCASYYNHAAGGIVVSALNAGGSGYAVNDAGTVSGGNGDATYIVNTVSGGAVATFTINQTGTAYSNASAVSTTATSGSGTGFKINITQVSGLFGSFNQAGGGAGVNNPYAQALYNFSQQAPNSTGNVSGAAKLDGKAAVQ